MSGHQSQVMQRTGARSDINEHRRKFRSLGMGITELLSSEELKELNDKRKAVKDFEDSAAIARPYARFPRCQTLEVYQCFVHSTHGANGPDSQRAGTGRSVDKFR